MDAQALADLQRRGFSAATLRRVRRTLRDVFGVGVHEAMAEGGTLTLCLGAGRFYVRTTGGDLFDMDAPTQPLLMVDEELSLRPLTVREPKRRAPGVRQVRKSGTPSPRRPPDGE